MTGSRRPGPCPVSGLPGSGETQSLYGRWEGRAREAPTEPEEEEGRGRGGRRKTEKDVAAIEPARSVEDKGKESPLEVGDITTVLVIMNLIPGNWPNVLNL